MIVGGLLVITLPIIGENPQYVLEDNPRYAPGEASAMVERIYGWHSSDLAEMHLGQGI